VRSLSRTLLAYLEVLKPAETMLLAFIGVAAAFIAGHAISMEGSTGKLAFVAVTLLVAAAGANGLTNYLDRDIDLKMERTRARALPSGRIHPAWRVLPLTVGLTVAGLVLSWQIQPVFRLAFFADVVGTIAALVWRKRSTCVFPQGLLAGCAPVLIGWFAIRPAFSWELALLCGLIGLWLPLHVWSVMISHREDYAAAGLKFFPIDRTNREAVKLLLIFSLALSFISIALYLVGDFSLFYLMAAIALSTAMVYATSRLFASFSVRRAWRLYKLSSFPYMGLIFLAMCIDVWLFR